MRDGRKEILCPECGALNPEDSKSCGSCGTSLEFEPGTLPYVMPHIPRSWEMQQFSPGDIFAGRYVIVEEIGRGGMGVVYKARDNILEITVALKIIRPKYASNPKFIKLFKQETLLARSLSHPNIIRIHDMGQAGEIKYISMDHIEGQNLKELIRTSGKLGIETALQISRQICSALAAAHAHRVVHCDLKPRNIMLDRYGRVYTMDFGLARSVESKASLRSGGLAGTPQYLSPEQAKGEALDHRTDIYALGLILFEMVTGRLAFEGEDTQEYIEKHIREAPPSAAELNPLVPSRLEKIIKRCLDKDPERRYAGAEEVLKDLDRISSRKGAPSSRSRSLLRRLAPAAGAPLLLLLLWAGYRLFRPAPAPGAAGPTVAVLPFENHTGASDLDHWRRAFQRMLIKDLYQSQLLRILPCERIARHLGTEGSVGDPFSPKELDLLASREHVHFFLIGGYFDMGDRLRIDAQLLSADTYEPIGMTSVSDAYPDGVFDLIDSLTPWVKEQLDFSQSQLTGDVDDQLRNFTTSSVEALVLYLEAVDLYEEGRYQESQESLEAALAIDPEFAMAHSQMATNYFYMSYPKQGKECLARALELSSALTPRERYHIEGFYLNIDTQYRQAIRNYRELLDLYPQDERGIGNLGGILRNIEEWDEAEACFLKYLELEPESAMAYQNLIEINRAKGGYEKCRDLVSELAEFYPHRDGIHRSFSRCWLSEGNLNLSLVEVGKAISIDPENPNSSMLLGNVYHVLGELAEAEEAYLDIIREDSPYSLNESLYWRAHLFMLQGRMQDTRSLIREALERAHQHGFQYEVSSLKLLAAELDMREGKYAEAFASADTARSVASEAGLLSDQVQAMDYMGLCLLGQGRIEEARSQAEELKRVVEDRGYSKLMRHYHHLRGKLAEAEEESAEAEDLYRQAVVLLPHQYHFYDWHAYFMVDLADLYFSSGQYEKALREYERIVDLTTGRLLWNPIYATSLYRLGLIHTALEQPGRAAERLQQFLDLWKDADPGIPEVADAQERLAELR